MTGIFPIAILLSLILGIFGLLGLVDRENSSQNTPPQATLDETTVIPGIGGGPGSLPAETSKEPEEFKPFVGKYTSSAINQDKIVILEINRDKTATLTQSFPDRVVEKGVWASSEEGILVVGLIEKDGEKYPNPIYLAFVPEEEDIVLYNLNEGESNNQGLHFKKQQSAFLLSN